MKNNIKKGMIGKKYTKLRCRNISIGIKLSHQRPEVQEKLHRKKSELHVIHLIKAQNSKKTKMKRNKSLKKAWKNSIIRSKWSKPRSEKAKKNIKISKNRPEVKAKFMRTISNKKYKDKIKRYNKKPDVYKKKCKLMKEISNRPEVKEKHLISYIKRVENGTWMKTKWFNTSIEILMKEALKNNNLEFIHQKYIKTVGMTDFTNIEKKIIVECYGGYPHANKKYYKKDSIIYKTTAEKIWEIDKLRIKNAKKLGYITLVFWDYQIQKKIDFCINKIKKVYDER